MGGPGPAGHREQPRYHHSRPGRRGFSGARWEAQIPDLTSVPDQSSPVLVLELVLALVLVLELALALELELELELVLALVLERNGKGPSYSPDGIAARTRRSAHSSKSASSAAGRVSQRNPASSAGP